MATSRVNVQVGVSAPPHAVWEFLIDMDRHKLWNGGLMELSVGGKLRPGLRYTQSTFLMGKTFQGKNRVAVFDVDRELGIENFSGPLNYNILYQLFPADDGGTRLVCRCDISGEMSFFNLAAPLLEYLAKSRLEADITTLKLLIERPTLKPAET